jgi:hypothetical protein
MEFKTISREDAIKLLGDQQVFNAEVYALTRETNRSLNSLYRAQHHDQSGSGLSLVWSFRPTTEMIERADWIDTQN